MGNVKSMILNKEKLCGIYKMYFDDDRLEYIGSSANLYNRCRSHLYNLRSRVGENVRLQDLFDKSGEDYLNFEILEICDIESLTEKEYCYINSHKEKVLNVRRNKNEWIENSNRCCLCGNQLESSLRNKIIKDCRLAATNYNIASDYFGVKLLHPNILSDFWGFCPDCMFEIMYDEGYPYIKKCKDCGFLYIDVDNNNVCSFCNNTEEGFEVRRLEYESFLKSLKYKKDASVSNEDLKEYAKIWRFHVEL